MSARLGSIAISAILLFLLVPMSRAQDLDVRQVQGIVGRRGGPPEHGRPYDDPLLFSLAPDAAAATPETQNYSQFVDNVGGATADEIVRYALEHNGELGAARQMIAEATGRLHQAGLKPNPMLESSYQKAVTTTDNSFTIGAELPLELGGRRPARVAVAERELEMRRAEAADFERKLAADVRAKYADAVVAARNLKLAEEALG